MINGFINPEEIDTLNVIVFVSHSHSDHYDPIISTWQKSIPAIKYVWGWSKDADSTHIFFDRDRRVLKTKESGLVVEELSYSPTQYPAPDARPALNELQWIQYQLDNHRSVQEVIASVDHGCQSCSTRREGRRFC